MHKNKINQLIETAGTIILGKEHHLRLALTCLLARGHLLIEDVPGVGKTTLAHLLAKLLGLQYQRIQFTSDLLPADIIGVSIYDKETSAFRFQPGPVFSQLVLSDEVNRASPKTQSALLEAMEENQITIDGQTLKLPQPFFVIATQNPVYQIGTFPLPESQLDRFLMRIEMGYPDKEAEHALLLGENRHELLAKTPPVLLPEELMALQEAAQQITASDRLVDYIQALLQQTRHSPDFIQGLSPRAGLSLLAAARAWALIQNRGHVLPEDVQTVFPYVAAHRLHMQGDGRSASADTIRRIIESVALV